MPAVTQPGGQPVVALWSYAAATAGILNTTTAVTMVAAPSNGSKIYITDIQVMAEALTNATELVFRNGAGGTVIWRTKIPTTGLTGQQVYQFQTPIYCSANTLLEVCTLSASGAGAVYVNAQGYLGS